MTEIAMNLSRHGALLVVLALAAAFASVPAAGAAENAGGGVGVVAEYRPAAARFDFTRPPSGNAVAVRIGSVVMAGDKVTLPAGASVTVQLANGDTSSFKGPGTFVVPDARPLGKLGVIYSSLLTIFDDEYKLAGTAASRGGEQCGKDGVEIEPIHVPILVPGARVIAGVRDLPLAWRGGCPPFVVKVLSGANSLVYRESIAGWQVRLDDVPLTVGTYKVVVTDAQGRQLDTTLEAVKAGPTVPPDLAADGSNLGITAQAIWLAGQDSGRWRLESFERLRPLIRAGDPLAGSIGDGVLWGAPPR
jgi:hypothetical protein